eukprot:3972105-Prymnesium_polylepis.2
MESTRRWRRRATGRPRAREAREGRRSVDDRRPARQERRPRVRGPCAGDQTPRTRNALTPMNDEESISEPRRRRGCGRRRAAREWPTGDAPAHPPPHAREASGERRATHAFMPACAS